MFFFAIMDTFIKVSSNTLGSGQILFWVGLGGTLVFAILTIIQNKPPLSVLFFKPSILFRNLGEIIGTMGMITAITLIPISTASAVQQATPLVVSLLAVVFGEKIGIRRWAAICFGFLCVLLIIRPGAENFNWHILFAVLGVIGLSIRDFATRWVPKYVSTFQLSVYGYIVLIPTGLIMLILQETAFFPKPEVIGYLSGIVIFSCLAYYTITLSLRDGDMAAIMPFRYSRLLFALCFGMLLFGERPDWQTILGALGIIFSGLIIILQERKQTRLSSDLTSG